MGAAPEELAAFVRREHPRLVGAVTLLLDDHAVAEEIAQETLLRVASRWERVSRLDSPGGWAHRVAVNLATSQLRRWRVERRARQRLHPDPPAPSPDPVTAVAVREALRELPERQRRALVLRHVLGWTATEIADLDGATPEAIRQQLRRSRSALRERLDLEGDLLDVEETSDVH